MAPFASEARADRNLVPIKNAVLRNGAFVLLAASAVVVVLATASTTSARFAAQTSNENNVWEAADLQIDVQSGRQLFLNGTGLYPGLELENCFVITYTGSVDGVDLRLHAQSVTGGLANYFELAVETGTGTASDCSDFRPVGERAFKGTIRSFTDRHGSFGTGLVLADDVSDGQRVTVRASGAVVDDNRAQGLDGRFIAVVEARP